MSFEEKLNNILYYENWISKQKKQDFYDSEYPELRALLSRSLKEYIGDRYRALVTIVEYLDQILKFTNSNNMEWIRVKELYKMPNFMSRLASAIHEYPFKDDLDTLLLVMAQNSGLECNFFTEELIESFILSIKKGSDCAPYKNVFNSLSTNQKLFFLQTLLKHKKKFNIRDFSLDIKCLSFVEKNLKAFCSISIDAIALTKVFYNDKQALNTINEYYKDHNNELLKSITSEPCIQKYNKKTIELIKLITDDIIRNENALISEIEWIEGGSYSDVLIIKNKVLKIGEERATPTFPNNPYIVKPLLRKSFPAGRKNIVIEVMEKVEVKEDFTTEDVFELYEKLRKIGLIWGDPREANIGRLIKSNGIYWNGNLEPTDEALGLEPYRGEEELATGNLVIIDADFIFKEEDLVDKMDGFWIARWENYEKQYQKKLQRKDTK